MPAFEVIRSVPILFGYALSAPAVSPLITYRCKKMKARTAGTMVMTMPDGKACMIAAGDNWEMVTRIKGKPV